MLRCGLQRRSGSTLHKVGLQKASSPHRINPVGIQMISERLRKKVFPRHRSDSINSKLLSTVRKHLEAHKLSNLETPLFAEPDFEVPDLVGQSITEHFQTIAANYTRPYLDALRKLTTAEVPPIPSEFVLQAGWVRYSKDGRKFKAVATPKGDAVVFDVETMVTEGGLPAMAVALTATHWYSWCSEALAAGRDHRVDRVSLDLLIPMESGSRKQHRVIVGHNVGFDRGYVREQYSSESSNTRFLDTLSMHVCVSGQTSEQKIMTMSVKKKKAAFEEHLKTAQTVGLKPTKPTMQIKWMSVSSLNNLADVYGLYCDQQLEKSARDTFVTGSSDDVRKHFQYLMKYCTSDVLATRNVLTKLLPLFLERFPHRATFFGMLETLSAYLPVNEKWDKFLGQCNAVFEEQNSKVQFYLIRIANETCKLLEHEAYKSDPWVWDLDWSAQDVKCKKSAENQGATDESPSEPPCGAHPKWFRDLCDKNPTDTPPISQWNSGPWSTSLQRRCIPKLLRIMWDGYPVHHHNELGWGYLVPRAEAAPEHGKLFNEQTVLIKADAEGSCKQFPLDAYLKVIAENRQRRSLNSEAAAGRQERNIEQKLDDLGDFSKLDNDWKEVAQESEVFVTKSEATKRKSRTAVVNYDIGLKGVLFKKLPQRPGSSYNVGSPLSRSMIEKYWGTMLSSWKHDDVVKLLDLTRNTSYWKKVRNKIADQMVVWFSEDRGAILPRIMPAGTIYRRAVDRTWSTTMYASKDQIGSEFKAMVQAPDGHHFIGFPSDRNELWIAALLGDADFARMHGSTALGWRVLQGPLLPDVDVHKETAKTVGCTEEQAKILDYVRLHGGGKSLLCKILMEFNPTDSLDGAAEKTNNLLRITKGERKWPPSEKSHLNELSIGPFKRSVVFSDGARLTQVKKWHDGSESRAFNRIEQIASESLPSLPFLNGRVSRALEPRFVFNKYAISRINWVVQSSVVDFQHLSLLSVKQLFDAFGIKGRFSMTMHDGMKFMVSSKQRYKAALALHISNLYVSSFCAESLGMDDLPLSAAFRPFVTVDQVLRRDVFDDCVTPSNPRGLREAYNVPGGERLDIYETLRMLQKTS